MANLCKVCANKELVPEDTLTRICAACRTTLGIIPMPPPRRRAAPCQRCHAMRFVRVIPREYTATGSDYVHQQVAPMTATHVPNVSEKLLFRGNEVFVPNIKSGLGVLEMYICAGCGFVEWYCQNPEAIPIGPEYMSDVVDYEHAPYR
jgi:hypothetical protein